MGAEVYIITGQTGAGKTTYAIKLAKKTGGARFSIDEWMTNLFWMDSPPLANFDWAMERIDRCEKQISDQMTQLAKVGISLILDLGFTRLEHRRRFAQLASDIGCTTSLHWVDVG